MRIIRCSGRLGGLPGGVSAQEGFLPRRGVSAQEVYTPDSEADTPWTEWQTIVKTLPFRNYCYGR